MDKNTTQKNLNAHSQKAVLRDSGQKGVVSLVRRNVSENSFLFGNIRIFKAQQEMIDAVKKGAKFLIFSRSRRSL